MSAIVSAQQGHVYLLATLDTKGTEAQFVRDCLVEWDLPVRIVDAGVLGEPLAPADIPRESVFAAAGTTLHEVRNGGERAIAVEAASRGVRQIVAEAFARGELSGVVGLGGSAGTTISTSAMRILPIGVPKVMVSTLASGQVRPYVGDKDICMLNSVVDIAGVNRISRLVLRNAAAAMAGMVRHPALSKNRASADDKPLIAATMFGVTTPCVTAAKAILEQAGCEVLVFHATGSGGQAMESLIREGLIAGVLDITTTELADERVGGVLSAGPTRLTAAAEMGIPQVVSVGALDMVNFGPPKTIPERFRDRKFHIHNASVTLMRTTPEENAALGAEIGRKVAASKGPAAILLPLSGVSAIDKADQPFDDAVARAALRQALYETHGEVEVIELPVHINDLEFAQAAAQKLLALMTQTQPVPS